MRGFNPSHKQFLIVKGDPYFLRISPSYFLDPAISVEEYITYIKDDPQLKILKLC